ncbi:MAG: hypothetical protein AB7D36_00475 [Oscillospiraceae bacterium]
MKKDTTLAYFMDLLEVGGKELAIEIGTDTTTISKWRTGKRRLSAESGACRAIAAFFLSDRFSFHRRALEGQLDRVIDGFSTLPYDEKIKGLCYILGKGNVQAIEGAHGRRDMVSYQATTQVYSGEYEGWKLSIEQFWAVALAAEPTQITLCDFGDIDWNTTEPERFRYTSSYVIECVKRGHRVCIIDILGDSYRSYEILGRWMDMYMTDGVDIHYIIGNFTDAEKGSYYMIKDKLALVGYYYENKPELLTYTLYTDYRMLYYYQARVEDYISRSKPVFFKHSLTNHMETVNLMANNLCAFDPTYMVCPVPTYINMPPELLREVLEKNGVAKSQIELCLDTLVKRQNIRHHCKYIQIYDIDAIEERLQLQQTEAYMLSRIIGKSVYMTKEQYLRQLQYVSETVERGEMEIDLVSFKAMGIYRNEVSLVTQVGRLAIIWDDSRYDNFIYSTEPTYIGGFFSYMENLYASLPPINKNMDWVRHRLREYVSNG